MMRRDARARQVLNTDVLVVGGGAAGVAAAVTAGRQGLDVTLIERYGFCGGGAVAGMSGTICGMYEASDDVNRPPVRVVHGFLDDFVARMEATNGLTAAVRYGKTFTRVHDPLVWREVADRMLTEAGVHVIYHTLVTDVQVKGDRIEGVEACTRQGRLTVNAHVTIDSSGDADLIAMWGMPFMMGQNGQVQNPTMIFRIQGVDIRRFKEAYGSDSILPAEVSDMIKELNGSGSYYLPRTKVFLFETPRPGELLCNATRVIGSDGRELNPVVTDDLTEAEFEGRRQVREYGRFFRDYLTGCEGSWVNDTGVQVGVRQSRQVCGADTLMNEDVEGGVKRQDGVAKSAWPIELHKGDKPSLVWVLEDYYDVPFGCFVPEQGENLLVAGRCLSAEHEAMASARVTAQCFSYGHAIGHAAAIAVQRAISTREIPVAEVRTRLNAEGAGLN